MSRVKFTATREEIRSDFETSILFRPELHGGKQGFLVKKANGTFVDQRAELLFQGYAMAREADEGQLRRYAPDRYIGNGHMTELREKLGNSMPSEDTIRTILKTVGGWPV